MKHKILPVLPLSSMACIIAAVQKASVDFRRVKLARVFDAITQQTGLTVAYGRPTVNPGKPVTVRADEEELAHVPDRLLTGMGVIYEINGKKVYLKAEAVSEATHQNGKVKKISGVIADEKGEPVIGTSIAVKEISLRTITNVDGEYTLMGTPEKAEVVISLIGHKTRTFSAGDKALVNITLKEDSELLEEAVVVGYGVQKKNDVSTFISSVKAEDIAKISALDFHQALAGKMLGVQVTTPSDDPEGNVSIRARGISTINVGSGPFYIIDGMSVERDFVNLNNNDIESVEVLKDASSIAIYDSRGSNGVIIITTKQGQSEEVKIQHNGYYGIQNVPKKLDMMNAYQLAEFAEDGHDDAYLDVNLGASPDDPNGMHPNSWERVPIELFPYLNGDRGLTDINWQDAIFCTAGMQSHNISASGCGKTAGYFVLANYYDEEGVVINSDSKEYSVRMNLDGQYKKFKLGVNLSPSYSASSRVDASGAGGVVQSTLMMPPVWPVYNAGGSYNYQRNGYRRTGNDYQYNAILNPVVVASLQSDIVDHMATVGKVLAKIGFLKGLTYNIFLDGDYYGSHNDTYCLSELPLLGQKYYDTKSNPIAYSSFGFYFSWLIENRVNYNTTINEDHSPNLAPVQLAQKETYKGNNVTATDFPNDYIQAIGGGTVTKGNSGKTQWSVASYLARVQHSYKGKYTAPTAIQADGPPRFGKNNRWGYFSSASAAWRISGEDPLQNAKALSFIDDLKTKASYGVTDNFQIGNYDHLLLMALDNYIFGTNNGQLVYGCKPNTIKNEDLSWEKNATVNVGIDVQMFKGLSGVMVDHYNINTSNTFLNVPVPHLTGYSIALMNIGKVNSRGWEIALTSQKNFTKDFGYSFNVSYSTNTNEVKALGLGDAPTISTGSVDHAYYITKVGEPIGSYYLLVQGGIFPNEEEFKKYFHFSNTKPGDFRFVDVDGDGVMDLDKDRTIVGNYTPDFTYGLGGKIWYKGIDLDLNFQGVYGNEISNLNRRYIDNMEGNVNGTTSALDCWKSTDNPGNGRVNRANRKSKGHNGRTSTWHLEDGSYLRPQNVTLGYTLPQQLARHFFVEKLGIYVLGQNPQTSTNYSGYDPEVNARPGNSFSPGEGYGMYPLARTFLFGLNITP